MALLTKAPRGTQDVLPGESHRWQYVENTLLRTAELFGFREIRFPTFEHTELFQRSVGDTTDVVQKEMYTFTDKGDRSITLRPEGTAGTVRAVMEHGLLGEALPLKVSYITSCFRYEKPQAGRLREFHQFGAEVFGSEGPSADAELIAMASEALTAVGVPAESLTLEVNSIGCPHCRPKYHDALKAYFEGHKDKLCPTCLERLEKNPLRILDCKSHICGEIAAGAPVVLDHLCEECSTHFQGLQTRLDALNIPYVVNPRIVRGLDYYTKTVFEFVSGQIGAQGTVCGGGRYDGLVEELGGQHTPALGFGMGVERLLLVLDAATAEMPDPVTCDIYLANMGEAAALKAFELCGQLRQAGFYAECDLMGRSLKAQMKYANKLNARYSMVLGDSEIETGKANLKNMSTGEQTEVEIGDDFSDIIYDMMANAAYNEL
ncbi:MAG: histidine--tRNA ligase [Oscillospiraceae bacterium]|nr:histidine--tRNA ligase [Oscillospiraceae bacterium]